MKKLNKKLVLNKVTIADMKESKGGVVTFDACSMYPYDQCATFTCPCVSEHPYACEVTDNACPEPTWYFGCGWPI